MTLGSWLAKWLALYVEPSALAPRTKEMYTYAVGAVPAALAAVDLAELTVIELQVWLIGAAERTPRAAQQYRVMLCRALHLAAKLGLCHGLVIDHETLPKPEHKARKAIVLDDEQLRQYAAAAHRSPMAPLLLLCCCGLRRGEALGVQWTDLDLINGVLHVQRQRYRAGGEYVTAPLKSDHSDRRLQLPPILVELLRSWPRTANGYLVDATPEQLHRAHRTIIAQCWLPPVTLHGLRHSFATCAASQGCSLKLLQAALGHASMGLTADLYADHLQDVSQLPALVLQAVCT